jgi:hypothetical protein
MLEIKTADELIDPELEARWTVSRPARQTDVFQRILRRFVEAGGPIPIADLVSAFPDRPAEAVNDALAALDDDDLIRVRGGHVDIAYPFSAIPTAFVVRLADGQERYACCAIDALGIAPMLSRRVHIRSRCYHCEIVLDFTAWPHGPGPDADGVMVWIATQTGGKRRVATSL